MNGADAEQYNLVVYPKSKPAGISQRSLCVSAGSPNPGPAALMRSFAARMAPLFAQGKADSQKDANDTPAAGRNGLILCLGWVVDLAVEYTGDPDQPLPIQTPRNPGWSAPTATYGDLFQWAGALREAFAEHPDLGNTSLGILFVGWASSYTRIMGPFPTRHPEVWRGPAGDGYHLDPVAAAGYLAPDSYPYATMPQGIAANSTSFYRLFARQLGRLMRDMNGGGTSRTGDHIGGRTQPSAVKFDTVMLRDGFSAQISYKREGPYGAFGGPSPIDDENYRRAYI